MMSGIVILVMLLGLYLNWCLNLPPDKVAPIVLGSLAVMTLFFTALTFEYNHEKNIKDSEKSKSILTYNTAVDWNKSPITDHIILLTEHQDLMNPIIEKQDADLFWLFLTDRSKSYSLPIRSALAGILNYFEYVSLGIEKGLIDESFVREFFETIFLKYYDKYLFYINFRRAENELSSKAWANFTKFAEKWRSSNSD